MPHCSFNLEVALRVLDSDSIPTHLLYNRQPIKFLVIWVFFK